MSKVCTYCGEQAVFTLFHRDGTESYRCYECPNPETVHSIAKVGLEGKSDNLYKVKVEQMSSWEEDWGSPEDSVYDAPRFKANKESREKAMQRYMELSQQLEDELIAEMGQEAYDASQHWINNPLIKPVSKVIMFDEEIKRQGDEAYGEGIAWERKRVEMEWQMEMTCDCENAMAHMKRRIEGGVND